MRHMKLASLCFALTTAFGLASLPATSLAATAKNAHAAAKSTKHKVIFQVSDADPKKWALALNNVANVQEDVGKENVDVEIVAYGPGLGMLKMGSEVGERVQSAMSNGVKVVACENTMRNQKVSKEDMLANIGYVKAGVVELMMKQSEGYAYIRP